MITDIYKTKLGQFSTFIQNKYFYVLSKYRIRLNLFLVDVTSQVLDVPINTDFVVVVVVIDLRLSYAAVKYAYKSSDCFEYQF